MRDIYLKTKHEFTTTENTAGLPGLQEIYKFGDNLRSTPPLGSRTIRMICLIGAPTSFGRSVSRVLELPQRPFSPSRPLTLYLSFCTVVFLALCRIKLALPLSFVLRLLVIVLSAYSC